MKRAAGDDCRLCAVDKRTARECDDEAAAHAEHYRRALLPRLYDTVDAPTHLLCTRLPHALTDTRLGLLTGDARQLVALMVYHATCAHCLCVMNRDEQAPLSVTGGSAVCRACADRNQSATNNLALEIRFRMCNPDGPALDSRVIERAERIHRVLCVEQFQTACMLLCEYLSHTVCEVCSRVVSHEQRAWPPQGYLESATGELTPFPDARAGFECSSDNVVRKRTVCNQCYSVCELCSTYAPLDVVGHRYVNQVQFIARIRLVPKQHVCDQCIRDHPAGVRRRAEGFECRACAQTVAWGTQAANATLHSECHARFRKNRATLFSEL